MIQAVRKTVRIGPGGRIELQDAALPEGKDVEVIVLLSEPAGDGAPGAPPPSSSERRMLSAQELEALPPLPFSEIVGSAPSGRTAEEVDRDLRALRDEWE